MGGKAPYYCGTFYVPDTINTSRVFSELLLWSYLSKVSAVAMFYVCMYGAEYLVLRDFYTLFVDIPADIISVDSHN